ncbi:MAG: methyltransferase domain-containing protein [Pseudomonadota bacterium]
MRLFLFAAFASLTADIAIAGEDTVLAAIGDPTRLDEHTARDDNRKPEAVLRFAGVKAGDSVADLAAGSGYYTALLSRVVGEDGEVYAVDPVRIFESFPNARDTFPNYAKNDPRNNVSYSVQKFDQLTFAAPLDAVVMGLYYHDTVWTGVDRAAMNKAIFDALKPGGLYLVFDHLAPEGAGDSVTEEHHRMVPGLVKPELEAAGFEFTGESDALAHPDDPRDISVFDETIRGRTDRFVFLFRKPF